MGGLFTDSQMGGLFTDSQMGGLFTDSQMGGLHLEMGVLYVPSVLIHCSVPSKGRDIVIIQKAWYNSMQ